MRETTKNIDEHIGKKNPFTVTLVLIGTNIMENIGDASKKKKITYRANF